MWRLSKFATVITILLACGCESDEAAPAAARTGAVTFTKDIAPIIFEHCSLCHRPDESAPFSLLSYQDVKRRAGQIARVTASGFMPPWLPESQPGEFVGQRGLTDSQVSLIEKWVEDGAVEGNPTDLPALPKFKSGWLLGPPDLVAEMPEPYVLPAGGTDVFRNFVIPIPVTRSRYVRAIDFRPSNLKVVHHARIEIDPSPASRQMDEQDSEPGYAGMINVGSRSPDGHFLAWTPGKVPLMPSDDLAWGLRKGTDLVVQLHMLPSGKPEPVQCRVGFHFSDRPPRRFPVVFMLGSNSIDIPAGQPDYIIEDEYTLPVDVELLSVYPHAHYLGKEMESVATLPDGTVRRIIKINDWDFNWQDEYRYVQPIPLPRGTVISMRFLYDNSEANVRNPNQPPKRVVFGSRSSDEMGNFILQVLPRNVDDLRTLEKDYQLKELRLNAAGFAKVLELHPDDGITRYHLGLMMERMRKFDQAIVHYRRALGTIPDPSVVHNNLGNVLQKMGKLEAAATHFREALRTRADFAVAHNNLGIVLARQGKIPEAIAEFEAAIRLDPEYENARRNLERTRTMMKN
jgi:Flp pilus assembly protein TadD